MYEWYGIEITKRKPSFQENLLKMFQTTSRYGVLFNVITCDVMLFGTDTVAALDGTAQM